MEQNLLTAISSVGFPIVVTLYLLTSFQRSMDRFDKVKYISQIQFHKK